MTEVWFWKGGRIEVHRLRKAGYEEIARSEFLPELDLDELASFVRIPDEVDAVDAYYRLLLKRARRG